jgi:hypothetical protein
VKFQNDKIVIKKTGLMWLIVWVFNLAFLAMS